MTFINRLVLAFVFTLLTIQVDAKSIDAILAQQVAENFLNQTLNLQVKRGNISNLTLVHTASTTKRGTSTPLYYVYNRTSQEGYVIISADDNVTPILGYSDETKFDPTNLPPQLVYWLGEYEKQINIVIANNIISSSANTMWDDYLNNRISYKRALPTVVKPLLKTSWDQSKYYWDACPYDNTANKNVYTGCVATAMAQTLKYWNYPSKGTGSHTYTDATYGSLSANFGSTTYNWSNMPNKLNAANTDVANLMFQCGVAIEMKYGVNGSSAWNTYDSSYQVYPSTHQALKTYFGYDATSIHSIFKKNYTDINWLAKIKAELNQARVVIYEGNDGVPNGSGHCFVADGYDANNYIHFNWGWSGAYNGYFTLTSLVPHGQGSGGGSGVYTSNQGAVIGIRPPATTVPSADFSASTTTTTVGQIINLFDNSTNNPTSWNWSISPSTVSYLNGTTNASKFPELSFSTTGKYAVTLTATNSKGSNALTKTAYIIVNPALVSQVCDSMTNVEANDTIYYYNTSKKGYVVGNNEYNHKGCAEKFTQSNSYTHVSGVLVSFAGAMASNATNTLNVNLYSNTNNLPGTILATKAVKLIDIVSDVSNNKLTTVMFDTPIAVSGDFYVGVEYNYASGDTVGINHVKKGNALANTAYVKYSSGSWYIFNTIWNMSQHLAIQALVSTLPTVDFNISSNPATINTNVDINASTSVGVNSYSWSFNGATISTSQFYKETLSFPTPGTFNIQLDVLGGCGTLKSLSKMITVNSNCSGAPATPGNIIGNATVCQGQSSISYSVAAVPGATSYVWTLPSGFTGTSSTNTINVTAPNAIQSGDIQVQAVNSCGTSVASTLTLFSIQKTLPTFTAVSTICAGSSLNVLPTTSLNNVTGNWSPALDNTKTTTYTFSPTQGQCANQTLLTIQIDSIPNPGILSISGVVCQGKTANIKSSVIGGVWTSNDNGIATVDGNGNVTFVSEGTATITYARTNNSCDSKVSKLISIGKCLELVTLDDQYINIFPNPTQDKLHLQLGNNSYVKYELIDPVGNILFSKQISDQNTTLNVSEFASGIYLIRVYDVQNKVSHLYFNKN